VPGNHETQCNKPAVSTLCSQSGKHAEAENEDAWRANMGDLILDDARFENLFGEMPSYENVANNGGKPAFTYYSRSPRTVSTMNNHTHLPRAGLG
jgi:hypothetical protein